MSLIRYDQGFKDSSCFMREDLGHCWESRPPLTEWSKDFNTLLENATAYNLFEQFLKEKNALPCIELLWILKGFNKRFKEASIDEMITTAKVIYRKLYKSEIQAVDPLLKSWLSEQTRREVTKYLRNFMKCKSEERDASALKRVFDEPLRELENGMKERFYPAFLQSDVYLKYIQTAECLRKSDHHSMSGSEKALDSGQMYVNSKADPPSKSVDSEKAASFRCISKSVHVEKYFEGTLPSNPSRDDKVVQSFMEKLVRIYKEREEEEKAKYTLKKLKKLNGERFAALPAQLLLDAMKDKLTDNSANDASDQSILDDHICRVWSPDRSPITRSRSDKHCHPPFASRDEYIIDGYIGPPSDTTGANPSQTKLASMKMDAYKWGPPNDYHSKSNNGLLDSDDMLDVCKLSSRKYVGHSLPQRPFGDGVSNGNLNMIGQEAEMYQRRQEYEGLLKSLPTPLYPGVVSESKMQSGKRFEKRRNPQQMSKPPMKLGTKPSEILTIGYKFADEQVPYMKKLNDCSGLTLAQFKQMISRKGPFVYYFKKESNEFGTGHVMEEITDDNELLPINEGRKIYAVIESAGRHS